MGRDITLLPPVAADRRVSYGPEAAQFFDLWEATGPRLGVAVMIHGGFWRARYDLTHASHLCAALARNGVATASLEYRRVGDPGGGWPGTLTDVIAGTEAVRQHFGEEPVILGHSAGGHLALLLASKSTHLRGIVALAPVASLQLAYKLNLSNGAAVEFVGGTPSQRPLDYQEACPLRHASIIRRELVHGVADEVVPIELSRAYLEARKSDMGGVRLSQIANADHFDLIDPESNAWPTVLATTAALLRSPHN